MDLFNQDIQKYIFKWKGKNTHGIGQFVPEVQNENGEKIGRIQIIGQGWFKNHKTVLTNTENSILLNVNPEEVSAGIRGFFANRMNRAGKFQVSDSDENMLGTAISPNLDYLMMDTKEGDLFFHNTGPKFDYYSFDQYTKKDCLKSDLEYQIKSIKGNNVATFTINTDVTGGWGTRDYNNTCILQIHDLKFDRKNILGMFICSMLVILDTLKSETWN